ncbi:type II toxin-antitoxin system PemK/MazF family toxin [Candidatus Sumerlaeota bacterium]|nr:type II toxin-antitoxin system PemK/MazF family toxin [Candidatus Sumerlaeota bacterium]MBI3735382.1 type II toxin-antitoxin system PemK/MazF family toxin [Candidatus Sumerlaeota bacterium]
MIQPGEIYTADLGLAGPHPVIAISREILNRGRYVLVVPCTSSRLAVRSKLGNCVAFMAGEYGFTSDCVAQCENIFSIDRAQLDLSLGPRGVLDDRAMTKIVAAIGYVMRSDCRLL